MPLSTDPDTLRIPAFMRKRSIKSRSKKPILLTALDRKNAGVLPEGIARFKAKRISRLSFPPRIKVRGKLQDSSRRTSVENLFAPPLLDFSEPEIIKSDRPRQKPAYGGLRRASNAKAVGIITHCYNKIHVAVIKLSGTLTIGDSITYDTDDGPYKEIVKSMEIDRRPAFKAGKGKEIGIKIKKVPRVGCTVYKS